MRPGIKILEETDRAGAVAVRGKTVIVNMRLFLPNGSELAELNRHGQRMHIGLTKRHVIAGVRYGIEGMRAGGRRLFDIRPHLAYGAKGVPGIIPPNTDINCDVELLEVRDDNRMRREDYSPGRNVSVVFYGELARCITRWQFNLREGGQCVILVTVPIPGLKWRHANPKHLHSTIEQSHAAAIFNDAIEFPSLYPGERVSAPYTEGGDSGRYTDEFKQTMCVLVSVY